MNRDRKGAALSLALAAALLTPSCSVKKRAIQQLGDTLSARLSESFATDNDPELVRAAVPFSLKLVESLLAENPRDPGLLLSAAKGFTEFAYAFPHQDADINNDADARQRAARLFLRGRDYGLRALDLRYPHFADQLKADPKAATAKLTAKDVPLMYWTGIGWAGALSASRDFAMLPQIPQFEALLERALALDDTFDEGALHSFFITFEMNSPTRRGDKPAAAKRHFDRAVELSHGHLAGPYVSYAENVSVAKKDRAEFESMLKTALKIDPNAEPSNRLQNLVLQRRARWLLSRADKLFPSR